MDGIMLRSAAPGVISCVLENSMTPLTLLGRTDFLVLLIGLSSLAEVARRSSSSAYFLRILSTDDARTPSISGEVPF